MMDTHRANNENCDQDLIYPPVQLTTAINMRDLYSKTGALFEISEQQEAPKDCTEDEGSFFDDESLINSLSIGAGNAVFDDDASGSDDEAEPFEKLAKKMVALIEDGGVLKMEVRPGIGGDIPSGASVTFHYSSYLQYCDEPFDSTYLRNKPEKKIVDSGQLLAGLNIAIKSMRKNETARFLVKPEYAYGKIGCQPRIPGNETILYEVYVIYFVDRAAADSYDALDSKEQRAATFQEKLEAAQGFHRQGNEHYREGSLNAARDAYTRAAWIMEDAHVNDKNEEVERGKMLLKMRSNLAQVFLDLKEPGRACTQCKLGLDVSGVHSTDIIAKLHFRFGKAKAMLHDFKSARKQLLRAQHLKPNNADISTELEILLQKEQKSEEQERFMYRQMFEPLAQISDGSPEGKVIKIDKSKKRDENCNSSKKLEEVRPEFERIVKESILKFAANPKANNLPFPLNLSAAEKACVSAAAKAANCDVRVKQRGGGTFLTIVKRK
ncbi:inactive peptidyl-prolyl cis-trans isomerase FKBP6 [Procambarus clarkii]|uniref:inactive peptidyl-prolyl cis-trans isomerase FKBP6 n=1 Tax=Procambarus clarkii TaxID=6728 RepID=UPI0037444D8E